jgi:ureidoacrylate peracid hydrolase
VRQSRLAVEQARAAGLPVIFTRHVYRPGRADEGLNLANLSGPDLAAVGGLAAGGWDGGVIDELEWTSEDLTVDKVRFDAFLWTSMDPLLQGLGVDQLLVCGVVTNICVESTVRAAFMRDYRVTLLGDACAAQTPRLHEYGLAVMGETGLANVVSLAEGYQVSEPEVEPTIAAA